MITPGYSITASERVLPRMMLDFTTAVTDARVATTRAANTATRFNASGAIEVVNANLARYDFDPVTLLCKGQLIEEARTNLFLNSLVNGTNLSTQSVTLSAVAYTVSFYGTGSIVISGGHSATVSGTGAFPTRKTYTFTPTAGSSTFTVSGTVAYAQLEAGSFATSFIPTAGSSVLRNPDVVNMTGTNFTDWYTSGPGTLIVSTLLSALSTANAQSSLNLGVDANNQIYLYANNTVGSRDAVITAAGAGQGFNSISGANTTSYTKQGFAFATNSTAHVINGGTPVTDTTVTLPSAANTLRIGSNVSNFNQLNGWVAKVMYWPQRLTNAELQAFTK